MTLNALMAETVRLGIRLEARGDRLHVDAPAGVVTSTLRNELARRKADLLALLAPAKEFITLKDGPTLPATAVLLALNFEARGFALALDADLQFTIEPQAGLTAADRAAIQRWRRHLGALVQYAQHPPAVM